MKHTTKYLYGVSPTQFSHMPYELALMLKIELAKGVQKYIIKKGRKDEERYLAAQKAIEFNQALLEEMEE